MRIVITNFAVVVVGVALFFSTLGQINQSQPYRPMALTPTAEPPTPIPTDIPTSTPSPTAAPTNTPVPTATTAPTNTPVPTAAPTNTPVPTATTAPLPPRDELPTPIVEQSDPALTKQVNPAQAKVGDSVEYTLLVSNQGSTPATDVVVEDPLPTFLEVVGAAASRGSVTINGATVRVVIGQLPAGENIRITIFARITQAAAPPQNQNRATLTTSSRTDVVSNNTATAAITINETAAPPPPSSSVETATPTAIATPAPTAVTVAEPAAPSNNPQSPQTEQPTPQASAKPVGNASGPPVILPSTGTNGSQLIPLLYVVGLTMIVIGSVTLVQLCLFLRRSRR
jgi:uncharacterized repeat protein (TIGR01451 family)